MKFKITALAALLCLLLSPAAFSQDVLKLFPEDSDLVMTMDIQALLKMMPAEQRQEMIDDSMKTFGYDISQRVNRAMIAMNLKNVDKDNPDFTGFFEANVNMDDLLAAASKEGKEIVAETVAGLKAYKNPDEDTEIFFSQVEPNLFVFGTRAGLENYVKVRDGSMANASSNPALTEIAGNMKPGALLSLVAAIPDEMRTEMGKGMPMFGDLTNMVVNIAGVADGLAYDAMIGATNAQSLTLLKGMMDQYIPMMKNNDTSGIASEVLNNFNSSVDGNYLMINGLLMQSTIDKLQKTYAPMMEMGMEAEPQQ